MQEIDCVSWPSADVIVLRASPLQQVCRRNILRDITFALTVIRIKSYKIELAETQLLSGSLLFLQKTNLLRKFILLT